MNKSTILAIGCALAGLAVLAGAFGAHGLNEKLSEKYMAVYKTAVEYHIYHALAIVLFAIVLMLKPEINKSPAYLFISGIILFSGSLYALSISSLGSSTITKLGMITPFGGLAFVAGWFAFAWFGFKAL